MLVRKNEYLQNAKELFENQFLNQEIVVNLNDTVSSMQEEKSVIVKIKRMIETMEESAKYTSTDRENFINLKIDNQDYNNLLNSLNKRLEVISMSEESLKKIDSQEIGFYGGHARGFLKLSHRSACLLHEILRVYEIYYNTLMEKNYTFLIHH